jgi:hypothetical protein
MALLNFPPNPSLGDTWTIGSTTWQWTGYAWVKYNPIQAGTNITTITNIVTITTTTNSTGTTTGALVVSGGVGVGGNLYVGGSAYINDTFTVEGTALFKNPVTFSGTATYVLSTNTVYTDNILHLHTPPGGIDAQWTLDDGKDIGIRIHYYDTTDTNAALVFSNNSKKFEFYKSGAEGTSTFAGGIYSGLVAGSLQLNDTTATSNTSTGALVVAGGVGIGKDIYVGGSVTVGPVITDTTVSAMTSNNLNLSSYTKTGITGSGSIDLDSYSGSNYRSSKYFIQVVDGTDVHVTEMSIFHNGTSAYKTEYGYHYNNGILGTFSAAYTASSVVLSFQPISATNMAIKVVRLSITP